MSLDSVLGRKRKVKKTEPEPEEKPGVVEKVEPETIVGTPAVIPGARLQGLANVIETVQGKGGTFSMNDILQMDNASAGVYDALVIPLGGQEHDLYRILERTRLTQYQIELFTDAIDMAEHGLGYKGTVNVNLDFPEPRLGEWVVKKMRAYVSLDGQSRAEYERVASQWVQRLYQQQQDLEKSKTRGVQ